MQVGTVPLSHKVTHALLLVTKVTNMLLIYEGPIEIMMNVQSY